MLENLKIDKRVTNIEDTENGIKITLSKYDYSDEYSYPNFELLLKKDNTLKFLNFLEPEGEYYSTGNSPLTRDMIRNEIAKQHKLLDQYDELFAKFNNIIL